VSILRVAVPPKLRPLAEEIRGTRYRHIILRGGRGSGKSWAIANVLVANAYAEPLRIIGLRETQKSIKESSHRLLGDRIEALGLGSFFDVQDKLIKAPNGSEFAFAGLREHTSDSIKSYEGFDIAWVEEAHAVKSKSANVLIPTLRKPGSKLIWSYNPDQEDDFVHQLANSGRDDVLVLTANWDDNPQFPPELEIERQALLKINEDLYDHVWGGKCRSVAGLLFKRNWFKRFDLKDAPKNLNYYLSSDYAAGPDPDKPDSDPDWTELGLFGMDSNGDLWATDWWSGQENPAVWIAAWLALIKRHKPLAYFEEKGVILRTVDAVMDEAMRKHSTFVYRHPILSAGDKSSRALGFAARAAAGTVWIPNTDWGDRLVNQLCAFNGQDGRTDDMVDVCSILARGLDMMRAAPPPPAEKKAAPKFGSVEWLMSSDEKETAKPASYYR